MSNKINIFFVFISLSFLNGANNSCFAMPSLSKGIYLLKGKAITENVDSTQTIKLTTFGVLEVQKDTETKQLSGKDVKKYDLHVIASCGSSQDKQMLDFSNEKHPTLMCKKGQSININFLKQDQEQNDAAKFVYYGGLEIINEGEEFFEYKDLKQNVYNQSNSVGKQYVSQNTRTNELESNSQYNSSQQLTNDESKDQLLSSSNENSQIPAQEQYTAKIMPLSMMKIRQNKGPLELPSGPKNGLQNYSSDEIREITDNLSNQIAKLQSKPEQPKPEQEKKSENLKVTDEAKGLLDDESSTHDESIAYTVNKDKNKEKPKKKSGGGLFSCCHDKEETSF